MKCDIEIFHHNKWHLAATFSVLENQIAKGYRGAGMLVYDVYYVGEYIEANSHTALSCNMPVTFDFYKCASWPPFLLDLLPSGAGRRAILNQLNSPDRGPLSDWPLLLAGAGNPPGNIRIKQAVQSDLQAGQHPGFTQADIIKRAEGFIEYAHGHGAPVAGSSGVQGDAPKFLLTQDHQSRWHADGALPDHLAKQHWIVKFPRGHLASDYAVLRNEFAYYQVAEQLGLRVHAKPIFIDNTLFIPRFDRQVDDGKVIRFGQESLTSLVGISDFGNAIAMQNLAAAIVRVVNEPEKELLEFIKRDIANIALGNTDNHGRNTAVRKFPDGCVELSPIYDFAPMILDNQGISRSCRWGQDDHGGSPDWKSIVTELANKFHDYGIKESTLRNTLYQFAEKIEMLPEILSNAQADDELIERLLMRIQSIVEALRKLK